MRSEFSEVLKKALASGKKGKGNTFLSLEGKGMSGGGKGRAFFYSEALEKLGRQGKAGSFVRPRVRGFWGNQ